MSSDDLYRQCQLRRLIEGSGAEVDVVWIPERFARKGRPLKIKFGEEWQDGWVVEQTYTVTTRQDLLKSSSP